MRKIVQLIFLAGLLLLPILTLGETGLEPLSLSILLENDTVDVSLGESVIANVTAKGGTPPYTYDFDWYVDVLDDNYLRDWVDYVRDATIPNASFMPPYGERGEVYAVVYDTTGERADAQAFFVITEAPERLICDVVLDDDSVQAGQPITATLSISGGSPPYQTEVTWFLTESNGNIEYFNTEVTNNKTTFIPLIGVSCQVTVEVSDSKGQTASEMDWFEVTGAPEPLSCVITLDKGSVLVDQPISASFIITGGEKPYVIDGTWWMKGFDSNYEYKTAEIIDNVSIFYPSLGSKGYFSLRVEDANGSMSYTESEEFLIIGAPDLLSCEVFLDKDSIKVGESITATWTITGGTKPYEIFYIKWWIITGSYQSGYQAIVCDGKASYTAKFGTKGYLAIGIKDAKGNIEHVDSREFNITDAVLISEKVNEIATECSKNAKGSYALARWLHDYLVQNAEYDYTYEYGIPEGVLIVGKGVCNSYATAYQLLLNKVGISNKLVSGEANNGTKGWEGHAWNLVSIGGVWYHVDVTWDDTGAGDPYEYFLKSDQFMSKDHRWSASRYPACPSSYGEASASKIPGDANGDGIVSLPDLVAIIDFIVSGTEPKSLENANANGSEDGVVDILDLVWVIDRIVGG